MNPLVMILLQAGVNIAGAHVKNADPAILGVIKTSGFLVEAAKVIDELYSEEVGQPLDWSSLQHHEHLPPAGEPVEEFTERTDPGPIPPESE